MDCTEIIAAAQQAIGGLDRLRSIRTYHAELRRVRDGAGASTVAVWRAAGGRIRIEEQSRRGRTVRVTNGAAGSLGDAERLELLRDARIAPRNMLAHADEYALALRSRPAPDGARLVSFPTEFVLYLFHSELFLCTKLFDLVRNRRIEYADYRNTDGILTPYAERHVFAGRVGFEDTYRRVAYNLDLADDLFEEGSGG
jgi:hypothetical protein